MSHKHTSCLSDPPPRGLQVDAPGAKTIKVLPKGSILYSSERQIILLGTDGQMSSSYQLPSGGAPAPSVMSSRDGDTIYVADGDSLLALAVPDTR
jgi:hypothetical protein